MIHYLNDGHHKGTYAANYLCRQCFIMATFNEYVKTSAAPIMQISKYNYRIKKMQMFMEAVTVF